MTVVTFALPKAFLQSLKMPGTKIYPVIIQRIKRDASQANWAIFQRFLAMNPILIS
jgi:hypothetical protein